ncbi:MAG TPA: sensor domain-containing diguanylate cyclase [Thermoanaerobaculia bacterium]|nr:sensor domain-containing diguanylate cyclase [Thermoanaerobaculia bacterium]
MSRSTLHRIYETATVVVAVALLLWAIATSARPALPEIAFFMALLLVASFLRIEGAEGSIGFEAAVAFPAIVLFHDPGVAFLAVFAGSLLHGLYLAGAYKRLTLTVFYDTAQLALSYYVAALLYTSAVARSAPMMAKISGYILLVVGYLVIHALFESLRHYCLGDEDLVDLRRALLGQGKALLLITPIVAVEIVTYNTNGPVGFAVAFLPLLLVAHAMRNVSDAGKQNADLVRRNRELSILTESATQILSAEGDQETLRRLTGLLSSLAKMKACAVVTWETNPDAPGTVYRFGECLPTDQEILRWVEAAGFAQSAPSRAFVFQNELRRFPLASGRAIQVLIGIQTPEVIYGILLFETEDPGILKTGSLNLLTLLVNQTALSLQDQLLRREMHEKTHQLESQAATMSTILEVSDGLIGSFDVDAMLTRIAQAVQRALGFEVVVFALHDPKRDEFVRRAHAGLDDVWEEVQKKHVSSSEITTFFNQDFRLSSSFFVPHTALRQSEHGFFVRHDEELTTRPEEWHENDMLLVPLMSAEQVIGYLSVREPHDRRVPTIEKVQTLEIFANQAVQALQSARQYDEIKRLTHIDALTPAYNHRYFQEALAKEIHRHYRLQHEFALAMLDIDDFKQINDTFGHPVGDQILTGLVQELTTNARDIDIVARYGGEEFAIIFPETPSTSARDAANRLRDVIERRDFVLAQISRTLHITVSIGVAVYPADGTTGAELIARADAALYHAKKCGKNRVCLCADLAEGMTGLA